MARTRRNVPKQGKYEKWIRTPRYKWKLKAGGLKRKVIVTDWDDRRIAACRETDYRAKIAP